MGRLVAEPRGNRFSGARATAALELLRLAATIGGTALRRSPANYFFAVIHIGVSASSDTGSKFFTTSYRSIWVAPFTMSVCQWPMLTDVCDLNGCRCG